MVFDSCNYTFNICRNSVDLLHILVYVSIIFVAAILALYCYNKAPHLRHIPPLYVRFLIYIGYVNASTKVLSWKTPYALSWTPLSNRTPYLTKIFKYTVYKLSN